MPVQRDPLLGSVVDGRYRVVSRLGEGGMGTVYIAERIRLRDRVAMKVLRADLCGRPSTVERFLREARAAATLKSEHVVEVYDFGELETGTAYYTMELLAGEDLAATLRRERRLHWTRARHVAVQIGRAIAVAHSRGIIHRDLKPDNCFRITHAGDPDFIKILDFGVAKLMAPEVSEGQLTQTGQLLGTTAYMPREQARGGAIDHRADIYALGVILYRCLTGVLPYRGENNLQVITAIITSEAPPVDVVAPDAAVPAELLRIVEQAMQHDRERRFPTMDAMVAALDLLEEASGAAASDAGADGSNGSLLLSQLGSASTLPAAVPRATRAPSLSDAPTVAAAAARAGGAPPAASAAASALLSGDHAIGKGPNEAASSTLAIAPRSDRARLLGATASIGLVVTVVAGSFFDRGREPAESTEASAQRSTSPAPEVLPALAADASAPRSALAESQPEPEPPTLPPQPEANRDAKKSAPPKSSRDPPSRKRPTALSPEDLRRLIDRDRQKFVAGRCDTGDPAREARIVVRLKVTEASVSATVAPPHDLDSFTGCVVRAFEAGVAKLGRPAASFEHKLNVVIPKKKT